MKRFVSYLLVLLVTVVCICGCGSNPYGVSESINKEYVKTIKDAASKLNTTYKDYIVANTLTAPNEETEYLEVMHDGSNYTEYSVDDENNVGTVKYGSANEISYVLTDWLTKDNDYYIFSSDEEGNAVTYKVTDLYSDYIKDRPFLYVNTLLDGAYSVEKSKALELDLGEGMESFESYKIRVKSDTVKTLLGMNSYCLYKAMSEDKNIDDNIKKLCNFYLEDLDMSLTFSDANVIVGIDNNGILKYMCLEVGGLGTRLYYTKAVVATKNDNARELPDTADAKDYDTTLQEMADFVSGYSSYDEALEALNAMETGVPVSGGAVDSVSGSAVKAVSE